MTTKRLHAGSKDDPLNSKGSDIAELVNYALDKGEVDGRTLDALKSIAESDRKRYEGSDIFPIVTDENMKVLLGVDLDTGKVIGKGIGDVDLGVYGMRNASDPDVIALISDVDGRVLIGYDVANKRAIIHGLTLRGSNSSTPLPKQYNLNHILSYGQSLSVGSAAGGVISTTQPFNNLTFAGGPRAYDGSSLSFSPLKPLVEDSNTAPDGGGNRAETICSGLGNYATLSNLRRGIRPEDHPLLVSAPGHGGYSITQLNRGTSWYRDIFLRHVREAYEIDESHCVRLVTWMQGENDVGSLNTAGYLNLFLEMHEHMNEDIRAINGQSEIVPLLTYQMAYQADRNIAGIQQAQFLAAKQNEHIHLGVPLYRIEHAADNVHLTAFGYKTVGAYFGKSYSELMNDGKVKWLEPLYVERTTADTLTVHFDVPTMPLTMGNLPEVADSGFAIYTGSTKLSIATVNIVGSTVVITSPEPLPADCEVRYGMDNKPTGMTITNGAGGSLSDSHNETVTIDGTEVTLFHACPYFALAAQTLEI